MVAFEVVRTTTQRVPRLLLALAVAFALGAIGAGATAAADATDSAGPQPPAPPAASPPATTAPPEGATAPQGAAEGEELSAERTQLEAAVASEPASAAARLRLGDYFARTGDVEAALASFARAAELAKSPDDLAAAHLAIAILERQRGNADEALRRYDLALQSAPREPLALEGEATLLAQLGRYRDAVPYFGRLIAADPGNPQARIGGTTALILAGEYARAKIALEQAITAFPDNLNLLDILARHLAACPDHSVRDGKVALELAQRLADKVPTAESHETLAMAYAQAGQFDKAVTEQQELIQRFADNAEAADIQRWRANLDRYQGGHTCCVGE